MMKARCVKCGHRSPRFETNQEFVDYYRSEKYPWLILGPPDPYSPYEHPGVCPRCMEMIDYDEDFRDAVRKSI